MMATRLPRNRTCSSVSAGISLRRKASAEAYGWWVCTMAFTSGRRRYTPACIFASTEGAMTGADPLVTCFPSKSTMQTSSARIFA